MATDRGQIATWTVLFTDMVGSTEMRVRVGEGAFDRVRADLDRRVALSVAAHAGAAVKSTGDGVMAAFAATASALRCATAIQDAVADHNRQTGDGVALRVGMSVGDAVVDGGDLQGTAVVEAARLCAVAEPGTVLCSEAVRSVSANRSGCVFGEPRSVELKGLPIPVVVHEVVVGTERRPGGRARAVVRRARPAGGRARRSGRGRGWAEGAAGVGGAPRGRRHRRLGGCAGRRGVGRTPAPHGRTNDPRLHRPPATGPRTPAPARRHADGDRDGRSRLPAPHRPRSAGRGTVRTGGAHGGRPATCGRRDRRSRRAARGPGGLAG